MFKHQIQARNNQKAEKFENKYNKTDLTAREKEISRAKLKLENLGLEIEGLLFRIHGGEKFRKRRE